MSERRSKWDQPAESRPAAPSAGAQDASAAAAAAAAKIAAQFGKSQDGALVRHPDFEEGPDGAFSHDIEINDQRNRYLLTKGQTQDELHQETGARVYTKGTWYPDKSLARPNDPPLYLHITADTRESLDRAVARVNELMAQDLPPLLDDRLHRREERRDHSTWSEDKVPVPLEPLRNFNVRAKVVGPGGLFVKYIQSETRVRTQLKGAGSGYIETVTGREADEPMFIHLTGPDKGMMKKARELSVDLVDAVTTEWNKARAALGMPYSTGNYGLSGVAGTGANAFPGGAAPQWGAAPPPPSEPAPPPPPDSEVPPPPEDEAPPPPPTEAPPAEPAPEAAHTEPAANGQPADPQPQEQDEDAALRQYWKDYIAWEKSFVNYHGRRPTAEEGAQDVPPEYQE